MTALGVLIVGVCLGADPAATSPELLLGDPAPPLALREFIKGEAVKEFEKDKVYVLEFWATWCGPCRRSIPHVTELQKKYSDVVFIGVDVNDDPDAAKEFVDTMGDKMKYRVAIDAESDQKDDEGNPKGAMSVTYLDASYQSGIPATFIVDGQGRVAWIGHPLEMEEPLAAIVAGKWDLAAEAKRFAKEIASTRMEKRLEAAFSAGDLATLSKLVDQTLTESPELENQLAVVKMMTLLAPKGDLKQAEKYFIRLIDEVLKDDWRTLLNTVGFVTAAGSDRTEELPESLRPVKASPALLAQALRAADKATKLASQDGPESEAAARDTRARVYFVQGKAQQAVEEQETAIGLTRGTQLQGNQGMSLRLREYRKAVSATPKAPAGSK